MKNKHSVSGSSFFSDGGGIVRPHLAGGPRASGPYGLSHSKTFDTDGVVASPGFITKYFKCNKEGTRCCKPAKPKMKTGTGKNKLCTRGVSASPWDRTQCLTGRPGYARAGVTRHSRGKGGCPRHNGNPQALTQDHLLSGLD